MSKRLVETLDHFNPASVTGGNDVFSSDIEVPEDGTLRIRLAPGTASVVALRVILGVTTIGEHDLLVGGAHDAGSWFLYNFLVRRGEKINIIPATTTVITVTVQFIRTE